MAYAIDEDELTDQEGENTQISSGAASLSGGGGGGQQNVGNPGAGSRGSGPSRFVEFERYYNANAGSANAVADNMAKGVQDKINTAQTGLQDYTQQFNNAVQGGVNNAQVYERRFGSDWDVRPGSYNGPRSFDEMGDTSGIRNNLNDAHSALQALQSTGGLQTSMAEMGRKSPSNTRGNDMFSAELVNRAGQDRFAALRNQYGDLDDAYSDAVTAGNDTIRNTERAIDTGNRYAEVEAIRREQEARQAELIPGVDDLNNDGGFGVKNRTPRRRNGTWDWEN